MRFAPNEDQAAFLGVLDHMAAGPDAAWRVAPNLERFDGSERLDRQLEDGGFYDCAAEESLGDVAAAAMILRLARLPVAVECAASALLRPRAVPDLPRPLAVIEGPGAVRFLPVARAVLAIRPEGLRAARLEAGDVETVDSLFAYPMGVLKREPDWTPVEVDPDAMRDAWRVAVAAELAGALKGGLDAVVAHVRDRRQFGRPLGSFQAVQHRLAGAAVAIEAATWLTLKAAGALASPSAPVEAATALAYAQAASTRVVYDLHQFMGAMGLTLEHPLHRWTYRARLLRSALGGAGANQGRLAEQRWRAA